MLEGQTHVWGAGTVGLRLAPSVRVALERRCAGACEGCGLEWRWALYVFKVDEAAPGVAANLIVLCSWAPAARATASCSRTTAAAARRR